MEVSRKDLVSGYLGRTAKKTEKIFKKAKGGVLFIDEAYALGNADNRDSFAKECIDTLCEALSDNKDNIMVIIAGYEEELNRKILYMNEKVKFNKKLCSKAKWFQRDLAINFFY